MAESSQTKMGRRDVLRIGAGVGAASAFGSASMSSTASAQVQSSPFPVHAAAAYIYKRGTDLLTGSDFDDEAYEEAEMEETHAAISETGQDMRYNDDQTFTQITNVLSRSKQLAYSDSRYEMVEAMNLGLSESEVRERGEDAVDDFYAAQQENLLAHFSVQSGKVHRMFQRAKANGIDTSQSEDGLQMLSEDGSVRNDGWEDRDILSNTETLFDGSQYTYNLLPRSGDKNIDIGNIEIIILNPIDTGSSIEIFDSGDFTNYWDEIENLHSEVIDEVNEFVDGTFEEYQSGDIDLADMTRSTELARMASNEEENPIAGADLAVMGLDANTDSVMTVELLDDGRVEEGSVYMMNSPEDGLTVGHTYSPGDFDGPVYLAFNNDDGSNVIELDQDFAIMDAIDGDGESLESVTYSDRSEQETVTTDTEELNEELQRLSELQLELQEQQRRIAEDSGGGGLDFGFDGGIGNTGLLVGAAAVVLALIGSSS